MRMAKIWIIEGVVGRPSWTVDKTRQRGDGGHDRNARSMPSMWVLPGLSSLSG